MKKNKKFKMKNILVKTYKESGKSSLLVFFILRFLVIICMILQILHGNLENAFLCFISIILLMIPSFIQHKLDITFPNILEIIIYLFIFSAEILGEINNFYEVISCWDTILHTINGFLCAAIGFSLITIFNVSSSYIKNFYLCIVAFCFSMTIGVIWEFFEYTMDSFLLFDMQKDKIVSKISSVELDPKKENNTVLIEGISKTVLYDKNDNKLFVIENGYLDVGINDTMKDLFSNMIGALFFCIFGYIYLKNEKNGKIIMNFVPIKGKDNIK